MDGWSSEFKKGPNTASNEKEAKTNRGEGTIYDFFGERKWLIFLIGFCNSNNALYQCFRAVLLLGCFFNYSMSIVAANLVPVMDLRVICIHTCILSVYSFWLISTRILTDKSLNSSRRMILEGIYQYDDEDEAESEMRKNAVGLIRKRCKVIATTFGIMATYALVLLPLSQYLTSSESDTDASNGVLNKYLPYPMYMPFNTHTPVGYAAAMLANAHYVLTAFGNGTIFSQIYVCCTVQLQVHLQILSHSLRNIQKRAYVKYIKSGHDVVEALGEDLYQDISFRKCMYSCLRANVRHHQTLIRFHKEFQPSIGSCFVLSAVLGSGSYACILFLILQDPPVNVLVIYIVTFLGEFVYNHFMCHIGQQLLNESSALFEALFSTPWFCCDKHFNQVLNIMMCYSLKPIAVKAIVLNLTANVKAHGDLMSTMYKLTNLVRR